MHLTECIRLAFRNISVNKLRSVLTMLGIIIGISAVITITTIGNSLKLTISHTMNDLGGANLIYGYLDAVYPEDEDSEDWDWPEMTDDDLISDDLIASYKEAFSDQVSAVLVDSYCGGGKVTKGDSYANCEVIGSAGESLAASKLTVLYGRDISERDNAEEKYTVVISDVFAKNLFGDTNPIGKQIDLPIDTITQTFTVVGVYEYDVKIFGKFDSKTPEKDRSTNVYVPVRSVNATKGSQGGYNYLQFMAAEGTDPTQLAADTADFFNSYYERNNPDWQFSCYDMSSELGTINTVLNIVTLAISIIASISLIVGGVGVMNIMLVSIVERTKEIGIRKALGARNASIRAQFLTEAVTICLIGGVLGILIGILNGILLSKVGSYLLATFYSEYAGILTITIQPSLFAIFISVLFSMVIGIVFGYYPANRAAKLSPITALGYE
jgi:putative ABC transport system permease protein